MGPMFSGKTSELIKRVSRESIYRQKKSILIKYSKDTRYSTDTVLTHDKYIIFIKRIYNYTAMRAEKLGDIYNELKEYDIVAIDEGQFFEDVSLNFYSVRKM